MKIWNSLLPGVNWVAIFFISALGFIGLHVPHNSQEVTAVVNLWGIKSIGFIGIWRWFWWILQILRAQVYLHLVFPRWRIRANAIAVEDLPPICFLVPTYKEKLWITERVFRAIALEAKSLAQPITLLVTSSSEQENAAIREVLHSVDPELNSIRLIQMVQTGEGKRKAMAEGLRELARLNFPEDTIVALMDGDSEITEGTLRLCLPLFRMFPKMGALTTDELPIVQGSYLFSEWFHLRLAQRHYQMSSVSLSSKVMCLTGRFSLFRAEAALHPSFAQQLERDTLDDWLWGNFKFLSGDDKSTWFWLLKRGYDMLYVPDAIVYSIETISGSLIERAYQNMRRWYGNMLRNSDRAIALGPSKNGWFMWFCLIDQRFSYWTTLITPSLLLIALLQLKWLLVVLLTSWLLFSRPLMLAIIFWRRESHLKPVHFPLLLMSQWSSSLVKVWTSMNLAQQKWTNRGNQSISAEGSGWVRLTKIGTSRFLLVTQIFCFVIVVSTLANLLNPIQDLAGWLWDSKVIAQASTPIEIINASDYGIKASDGQDDSTALQALIDRATNQGTVQINLPIGEIELRQPLHIHRSNTIIYGQGVNRTILQASFNPNITKPVISIRPRKLHISAQKTVNNVKLRGFTVLRTQQPITPNTGDGIVLEKAEQIELRNLDIERSGRHSLVLRKTQNVQVQYVAQSVNS